MLIKLHRWVQALVFLAAGFFLLLHAAQETQAQSCYSQQPQCCYRVQESPDYGNPPGCNPNCGPIDPGCLQCERKVECTDWGPGQCRAENGNCRIHCPDLGPYPYAGYGTRGICQVAVVPQPSPSVSPTPSTPPVPPPPDCGWCEGANNCPYGTPVYVGDQCASAGGYFCQLPGWHPICTGSSSNPAPVDPCPTLDMKIYPELPALGQGVEVHVNSPKALACVTLSNDAFINTGNVFTNIAPSFTWKWLKTTKTTPGNYTVTFGGYTKDKGYGECPARGTGDFCQTSTTLKLVEGTAQCPAMSFTITPQNPKPGDEVTITSYKHGSALACTGYNFPGLTNVVQFEPERIADENDVRLGYLWKWTGTATDQISNHTLTFDGWTVDGGPGPDPENPIPCPIRAQPPYSPTSSHCGVSAVMQTVVPPSPSPPPPDTQAWWQVFGGLVQAQSRATTAIRSLVPGDSATPPNAFVGPDRIDVNNKNYNSASTGIILTGGGGVNANSYTSSKLPFVVARGSLTTKVRENYAYFRDMYHLGLNPQDSFGSANFEIKDFRKEQVSSGEEYYYHKGDAKISTPWEVSSDESIVVFIDGNLTIDDYGRDNRQMITVEEGGFLAFIVKGDIAFAEGQNTDTYQLVGDTPVNLLEVQGVYIADGQIISRSARPSELRAEGIFVAWNGFDLDRELPDGFNRVSPAERFIYRPDFLKNTPEQMLYSQTIWQETN